MRTRARELCGKVGASAILVFTGLALAGGSAGCGPTAPAQSPAEVSRIREALHARVESCKNNGQPTARCIVAAPKVPGEPEFCGELLDDAVTTKDPNGHETTMLPGSWMYLPAWRLVAVELLTGLPIIEIGDRRSAPLLSLTPSAEDAAPPHRGDFVGAFDAFRGNMHDASDVELMAADEKFKTFAGTVERRLEQSSAPDPALWNRYSQKCFADLVAGVDVIKADLNEATQAVRGVANARKIDIWVAGAPERCKKELADTVCREAPDFAMPADKERCMQACLPAAKVAQDETYAAGVKACAEQYSAELLKLKAKKDKSGVAPQAACSFSYPPTANLKIEDRLPTCSQDCVKEGKHYAEEEGQRRDAESQSGYNLFSFRKCMKDAEKSPEVQKRVGRPGAVEKKMKEKEGVCRVLNRCDWIEKYTKKKCVYKGALYSTAAAEAGGS